MSRLDEIGAALRAVAEPERAVFMARYLRAEPGGYGEGDVLIGVRNPEARKVARAFRDLGLDEIRELLDSPVHEERLVALVVLVERVRRADETTRTAAFDLYLSATDRINNWDLVDLSAPHVVGAHLRDRPRDVLDRLATSESLWERRIAILATFAFIRDGDLDDTFRLAETLLTDRHDLIHKAVGWMLREAGLRDEARLVAFLRRHAAVMPRTMLRYALEKIDEPVRGELMRAGKLVRGR